MSIMQRLYDSAINALVCSFWASMGADGLVCQFPDAI
jgi:hypothetical protein